MSSRLLKVLHPVMEDFEKKRIGSYSMKRMIKNIRCSVCLLCMFLRLFMPMFMYEQAEAELAMAKQTK